MVPERYLRDLPYRQGQQTVTVYPSVPPEVDAIRPGDWVALTREDAERHGRGRAVELEVPAEHVMWAGTDMNEFFHTPVDDSRILRQPGQGRIRGRSSTTTELEVPGTGRPVGYEILDDDTGTVLGRVPRQAEAESAVADDLRLTYRYIYPRSVEALPRRVWRGFITFFRRAGATTGHHETGHFLEWMMRPQWGQVMDQVPSPGLVSSPVIYTAGTELLEVDFALNLQEYLSAVDGADGRTVMDVQAAEVHEGGHMLGLWHSDVVGASLDPSVDDNPEARTLAEDDIEGLCSLYEGGEGEACVTADDCADGLSCLVDGGERYCTDACTSDEDCPADMVCADLGTVEQACVHSEAQEGCGCTGVGGLALAGLALLGAGLRRRHATTG